MMSKKRKFVYWLFKVVSIAVSCTLPIWAICERYPMWVTECGTHRSIGAGGILGLAVVLIILRRPLFKFIKDRLKLKYAPPVLVWVIMILISYALLYINRFMLDVVDICWMGFIGCGIGSLLTFIAENCIRKVNDENG